MPKDPQFTIIEIFNHLIQQHGDDFSHQFVSVLQTNPTFRSKFQFSADSTFPLFAPQSAGSSEARHAVTVTGVNSIIELMLLYTVSQVGPMDSKSGSIQDFLELFPLYEVATGSEPLVSRLGSLLNEFGSDKATTHRYDQLYGSLFQQPNTVRLVFEIGLGTNYTDVVSSMGPTGKPGASLRAFKYFFTNAEIIGCDIDERILFREERITTYHVDQTDLSSYPAIPNDKLFDLMIDDGLHAPHANVTALMYFLPRLAIGGYAVIEDIGQHAISFWKLISLLTNKRFKCTLFRSPASSGSAFVVKRVL